MSKNTVSRWWNGRVKPFDEYALPLARALGVPLDYLADDRQDAPPESEGLPEDERIILEVYRDLKARGALDRAGAIHGLSLAAGAGWARNHEGVSMSGDRTIRIGPDAIDLDQVQALTLHFPDGSVRKIEGADLAAFWKAVRELKGPDAPGYPSFRARR